MIPLASISKVTSIWGIPRLAGGIPSRVNLPRLVGVVGRHLPLSLHDVDLDGGLVVHCGGEHLGLLGGDGGVPLDERGCDSSEGLDGEGQRGDVEQEDVLDVSGQDCSLDGRTHGYALHGVDTVLDLGSDDALHEVLDDGHPGGSSDHDDLVDLVVGEACIPHCLLDGSAAPLHDGGDEFLEFGTGDGLHQVLGSGCVCGDERQVDLGLHGGGELDLGLLACLPDTYPGGVVLSEIDSGLVLELLDDEAGECFIHIGSSESGVSGGGHDLEHSVVEVHDGDIEGSSSEVEDQDLLGLSCFVESVGQCGGGGLVDDTDDVESCDGSGVLGRLPLVVVEVGGDGDDRFLDFLADECLCVLLDLSEDEGGDLLGSVLFAECGHFLAGSHFPLDVLDGSLGVGDCLPPGGFAHEQLAVFGECDVRREGFPADAGSFSAGDDGRYTSLHDGGGRVAGSEIDSDDSRHILSPQFSVLFSAVFSSCSGAASCSFFFVTTTLANLSTRPFIMYPF